MTRILRLLLIAAVAWPLWQQAAAQDAVVAVEKGVPQMANANSENEQSAPTILRVNKDDPSLKGGVSLRGMNPPSDAKVEQWTIATNKWYKWNGYRYAQTTFWTSSVQVAIYGNYFYIKGLSDFARDLWFRGTIDGTTVSFGKKLICGTNDEGHEISLLGYNTSTQASADIEFTYSLGEKSLTLVNNVRIWDAEYEDGSYGCTSYQDSGLTIKGSVSTNQLCPVYGYDYNEGTQHSQMIYPESALIFYKNSKLKSITFYTESGIKFSNGKVTVSLAIIDQDKFSSSSSSPVSANLTEMASIVPSTSSTSAWTITFNEPGFEYLGGNLLVDVTTEAGSYGRTTYYLESSENYSSYYSYHTSSYSSNTTSACIKYLPVVTFGYERMYEERDINVLTPTEIAAIPYTWKENGTGASHTGYLNETATDPDQIIAMLKEVYTNKNIPGNMRRGFTTEGTRDHDDVVPYTAVGKLSVSNGTATFNDDFGWQFKDAEVNKISGTSGDYSYWYMDPDQYRPMKDNKPYEGLTLLLLEMQDNFTPVTVTDEETGETLEAVQLTATSGYARLRECIQKTIKSARVISESRRTGEGMGKGTMFKIDCDKMNKFYLIAKGKLLWFSASSRETGKDFCDEPCYINGNGVDKYSDYGVSEDYNKCFFFLGHMFEQFSPAISGSGVTKDDIYQEFTKNMQSFGVNHDCPNVPYVENGHHFMMYDTFSEAGDCADVRDMMFFVPDYRMMDHSNRAPNSGQDYFRYNPNLQPTLGMFVIRQNEIPAGSIVTSNQTTMTGLYKHKLSWKSNLDDFLPGDMQEYELWELVVDEFGVESYQPVYYRNADGTYVLDDNGNKTPIVLDRQNMSEFEYPDVYVDMTAGSQTKTYVIRGHDKGGFLSLQMSNQEEIIIPGLDPNEKARVIGATYYSRYNPDNEKNCYSNKIELSNNGTTLTTDDLTAANNKIYFYRSSSVIKVDANGNPILDENGNFQYQEEVDEGGNPVTDEQGNIKYKVNKELVATGTANNGTLTIELTEPETVKGEFPVGESDGNIAGYHDNTTTSFQYSANSSGSIQFTKGLSFWDNFTVDVSKNAHPLQYLYKMEIGEAYSNDVRVPVYKTDSKISKPCTLAQVLNDKKMSTDYSPADVEFSAKVQLNSKTELLRYDAYRFEEKFKDTDHYYIIDAIGKDANNNLVESDVAPTGIAQNQGDYYTVTMNDVENEPEYYYSADSEHQPTVSTQNPYNWAKFIDKYPVGVADEQGVVQPNAGAYVYAPVVELYTKGYKDNPDKVSNEMIARNDYNTYGGPMQYSASGKLELTVDAKPEMSTYKWYQNGKWYSYYNVLLKFNALDVPDGYELYKVRAWRKVGMVNGESILGEEYYGEGSVHNRQDRLVLDEDGWFLYEDINYGDPLTLPDAEDNFNFLTMNKTTYKDQLIGNRSVSIAKPQDPDATGEPEPLYADAGDGELRATFGALRMVNDLDNNGTLTYLPIDFKVRAYFTRTSNPLVNNGAKAPLRDGEAMTGSGFDYYVAEGTYGDDFDDITTGIVSVLDSREVVGVKYYNVAGIESNTPFQGVNIVVTRYSDGSTTSTKILK